jgi:2,3-bisphosphoglycerate-dependent phosphoglycerate mutase
MRHGESEFNNANIFTGWCDVALTQRGVVEAVEAGQVFRSHELHFRKCYTSLLTRSIVTAHRSLEAAGVSYTPIVYDWRLNERHYGALQGLSKERTADRLGRTRVMKWRRSYEARPPLMQPGHPHYDTINQDPRYHTLTDLPLGESLEDCQTRVVESWREIVADIAGELSRSDENDSAVRDSPYSLVVAHANSLRALVMHLDDIPAHEIESLNIPTAIPFYYDVDVTTGAVLLASRDASASPDGQSDANRSGNHGGLGTGVFRGVYIADERKKRSFLERRRAANDPWLWALHDHQVERSMLVAPNEDNEEADLSADAEALEGMEQEAKQNTETHLVVSYW